MYINHRYTDLNKLGFDNSALVLLDFLDVNIIDGHGIEIGN